MKEMKISIEQNQPNAPYTYDEYGFDNLAHIMQQYRALHIEKLHNRMATTLNQGQPNLELEAVTDAKIAKIKQLLSKIMS